MTLVMMIYCSEFATELRTYDSFVWMNRLLRDGSEHPRLGPHGPTKEPKSPGCPEPSLGVRASLPSAIFLSCPPSASTSQFISDPFELPLRPLCAAGGADAAREGSGRAGRAALAWGRGDGGPSGSEPARFELLSGGRRPSQPSSLCFNRVISLCRPGLWAGPECRAEDLR